MQRPMILGSTGRVGRALRAVWPGQAIWHGRQGSDWDWDMSDPPPPQIDRPSAIICLAGATAGDDAALRTNTTCALAALALARRDRVWPLLILSSAAVYGRHGTPGREQDALPATTPYGQAKQDMEFAVLTAAAPDEPVLILRMANVAGCDALFKSMADGAVIMDRFADGQGPRRSYIGPLTLAQTLLALADRAPPRPTILNLAQPGLLAMEAILIAAGVPFAERPAPSTALPRMHLSTTRLTGHVPVPAATPDTLLAEARAAGWAPGKRPA
jgi:nucleoside-diphosphate-sugar epimerase